MDYMLLFELKSYQSFLMTYSVTDLLTKKKKKRTSYLLSRSILSKICNIMKYQDLEMSYIRLTSVAFNN